VPEDGEQADGERQLMLSRRQILTGTTYAIGATLLFRHAAVRDTGPEPDLERVAPGPAPAPGPEPPAIGAPPAVVEAPEPTPLRRRRTQPEPQTGRSGGRAVHRAQLADRGKPHAVTKGAGGVLVVGMSDDREPMGWLTEDGSQWIEHTLATSAHATAEVWGVAAHREEFVAVGSTTERDRRRIGASGIVPGEDNQVTYVDQREAPTVWHTTDARRWQGRTLDHIVGPHAQLIAVASDGDRLVAVGSTTGMGSDRGTQGLVVVSDGGRVWRRGRLQGGGRLAEGMFTGVTYAGGRWYASSVALEGGAVWTSADGRRWSVVAGSSEMFRGIALQGIGGDDRRLLVAATSLTDPKPQYFASRNGGRTWRPTKLDVAMLAGRDALVGDLAVIAGDVVVVGTHRGAPVLEGGELDAAD
jgi:hypothetical protein